MMKSSRFSEDQIIGILREHEAGIATADICRKYGISSATFYKWKAKYGGLGISDAKRLKALDRADRTKWGMQMTKPNLAVVPQARGLRDPVGTRRSPTW
jgi:putative transposase